MKKIVFLLIVFFSCSAFSSCNDDEVEKRNTQTETRNENDNTLKTQVMTIKIGNREFKAQLENSKTVEVLLKLLPIDVNMQELNGNEKYVYLSENLPTATYKPNKINKGDIMLYGQNCLVIFYKTFSTSYSYTKIGHIEGTSLLEESLGKGSVKVRFE
ncbi:MAG: hypothetical protein IJ213_03890 [Bacteroidales bacterium]|nr:hypothetical protein [Bacteroidales bacterium]